MSLRQAGRRLLVSLRLYPLVVFAHHNLGPRGLAAIGKAFLFYFFNCVVTFFPAYWLRLLYLRYMLRIPVGRGTFIHMGTRFEGDISIGDHSVIGRKCVVMGSVTIKNNVSITAETYIFTTSHLANDPDFRCYYTSVLIEDYAWIGARAMINPGVTIGKGAILGSTSLATKSIPDYEIFAGIPARRIGVRTKDLRYVLNYRPFFQ